MALENVTGIGKAQESVEFLLREVNDLKPRGVFVISLSQQGAVNINATGLTAAEVVWCEKQMQMFVLDMINEARGPSKP